MLIPAVKERAREVMQSREVVEKRRKVFGSDRFKERVGKASRASWDACSNEERKARAESQIMAARTKAEDKREAMISGLSYAKGRSLWNGAKRLALEHAKRKAANKDARDIRDPVADTEAWFGPSFEERHYRGVARTSRSRPLPQEGSVVSEDEESGGVDGVQAASAHSEASQRSLRSVPGTSGKAPSQYRGVDGRMHDVRSLCPSEDEGMG